MEVDHILRRRRNDTSQAIWDEGPESRQGVQGTKPRAGRETKGQGPGGRLDGRRTGFHRPMHKAEKLDLKDNGKVFKQLRNGVP